jgi:predicted transcriptional regulator
MYGFREFLTTNGIDEQIIQMYLENPKMPVSEIAHCFERSQAEIYRILHANDVAPNRLKANHQKVHNLASLGWGVQEIAEFTGYTPRNVRYILAKTMTEGQK